MPKVMRFRVVPFWIGIGQWATLMVTIVTCFIWMFAQIQHANERIDIVNGRLDTTNERLDQLYSTLIELVRDRR